MSFSASMTSTAHPRHKTLQSSSTLDDDIRPLSANGNDTKGHPVFSDFSHTIGGMGGFESTRFAVSLREEDPSYLINRILPLTKIIPSQPKTMIPQTYKPDNTICMRPECIHFREKLQAIKIANEPYRQTLIEYQHKLTEYKEKKLSMENEIIESKNNNEMVLQLIEERKLALEQMKRDNEEEVIRTNLLRNKLTSLSSVVETLHSQLDSLVADKEMTLRQTKSVYIGFPSRSKTANNSSTVINCNSNTNSRRLARLVQEERDLVKQLGDSSKNSISTKGNDNNSINNVSQNHFDGYDSD